MTNEGANCIIFIFYSAKDSIYQAPMYEKHGQPLEKVVRPKVCPYQTDNLYAAAARQTQLYKEVKTIVTGKKAARKG